MDRLLPFFIRRPIGAIGAAVGNAVYLGVLAFGLIAGALLALKVVG